MNVKQMLLYVMRMHYEWEKIKSSTHTFDLQVFIDIVATLLFNGSYDICEQK